MALMLYFVDNTVLCSGDELEKVQACKPIWGLPYPTSTNGSYQEPPITGGVFSLRGPTSSISAGQQTITAIPHP